MDETDIASDGASTPESDEDLITSMRCLGPPGKVIGDARGAYHLPTWQDLGWMLDDPELDQKKLSILSFYVCHDRARNCPKETKQALFDRSTALWMEYFHERLDRAQQEFTSDSTQLLIPLVTLMLQFCGAPISRDMIPTFDCFDPSWTVGDAMDHLSQALGYQPQTTEPPATFKPNETAVLAANGKVFGEEEAPDANEMIREFIRSAPFGVPVSAEVRLLKCELCITVLT
jgi:hypothetical protein